jgi:16S rRNA (guanine966-N2)-methyltransferase
VRIVRGIYKARRFSPPKSFPSRPTTDYAKEGLFNVLEHRLDLVNLDILDLCAGTGNISIEFLSREAGNVTSVDKHPICIRYMYKLLKELGIGDEWQIAKNDVLQFVDKTPSKYDLIFADPPYDLTFHGQLVQGIFDRQLLNPNGWVVIEHGRQTDLSALPHFLDVRQFGNVYFSFFKPESE